MTILNPILISCSFFVFVVHSILSQTTNKTYKIIPLPSSINTNFNEFGPSLTADGNTLYFYSKRNSITNTDIFKTTKVNGAWTTPVEVKELNSPYDDQSPFVYGNEQFIVFSSNRDGSIEFRVPQGIGVSRDLYYSEKIQGKWTTPMPLSENINTEQMEENPFVYGDYLLFTRYPFGNPSLAKIYTSRLTSRDIYPAQELPEPINIKGTSTISATISPNGDYIYFASNRAGGYGGYDIYRARIYEDGSFGEAENLGPEINTSSDEAYMIIHPLDKTFYFCRRKFEGTKDYDIYTAIKLKTEEELYEDRKAQHLESSEPQNKLQEIKPIPEIPPKKDDIFAHNESLKKNNKHKNEQDTITPSKTITSKEKELEEIPKALKEKKKLTLRSINFAINSSELLPESLPVLDKLAEFLNLEKNLKIKITGHTDLTGDSSLNVQLSWDRAESVKKYLMNKGIDPKRILTDGKGSTQPIIKDTKPESNKINRRTEFEIIE